MSSPLQPTSGGGGGAATDFVGADIASRGLDLVGLINRGSVGDVFLVRRGMAPLPTSCARRLRARERTAAAMKRLSKSRLVPHTKRIIEECRILQLASHPFIVRLMDAFETDTRIYYVMTYAANGDLSLWIDRFTPLAAQRTITEALLALEWLHSEKIIYRDLKVRDRARVQRQENWGPLACPDPPRPVLPLSPFLSSRPPSPSSPSSP